MKTLDKEIERANKALAEGFRINNMTENERRDYYNKARKLRMVKAMQTIKLGGIA